MPTIITKKCPKCKMLLHVSDIGCDLGSPFLECFVCHIYYKNRHRSEWDIMSMYRKIELLVYRGMIACVYAGWPLIILALIKKWVTGSDDLKLNEILSFYLIGLILSSIYFIKKLKNDIQLSRDRLTNQKYMDKLIQLGFIRKRK
jgi:hypothetical protein